MHPIGESKLNTIFINIGINVKKQEDRGESSLKEKRIYIAKGGTWREVELKLISWENPNICGSVTLHICFYLLFLLLDFKADSMNKHYRHKPQTKGKAPSIKSRKSIYMRVQEMYIYIARRSHQTLPSYWIPLISLHYKYIEIFLAN